MERKKDAIKENVNVELKGMEIHGTTSNAEIGGYEATGDIENAGHPERGFRKEKGHIGATSDIRKMDDE